MSRKQEIEWFSPEESLPDCEYDIEVHYYAKGQSHYLTEGYFDPIKKQFYLLDECGRWYEEIDEWTIIEPNH